MHRVDVDQMLDEITEEQFREWCYYLTAVDPQGPEIDDYHFASICSTIAAAHGVNASASKYMMKAYMPEEKQTPKAITSFFFAMGKKCQ